MSKIIPAERAMQTELAAKAALSGVCAILLLNSKFGGLQSPLSVSLASVLSPMCSLTVFAFSSIGFLFTGRFISCLSIILALLIICAIRLVTGSRMTAPGFCAAGAGIALAVGGVVTAFGTEDTVNAMLATACSTAIGTFSAYFFAECRDTIKKNNVFLLSGTSGCAIAVCFALTVATLASLPIPLLNIGRVFGLYITLLAAKKYRNFGGGICGSLTCAGTMLYSSSLGIPCAMLPVSAMLTGIFSELNNFLMSFFFISINAVSLLAIGISREFIFYIMDCIAAGALFTALPAAGFTKLFERREAERLSGSSLAAVRLGFASSVLGDIRSSTLKISELLEKRNRQLDVSDAVFRKICLSCPNRQNCWGVRADAVKSAFEELKITPSIERDKLPESIKKCYRLSDLIDEFEKIRGIKQHGRQAWAQLRETQGVIFDLMKTQEEILEQIRSELVSDREQDSRAARIASEIISEACGETVSCGVHYEGNLMRIEAYLKQKESPDFERICSELSAELERNIFSGDWIGLENGGKLYFCELSEIEVKFTASQRSADGFCECGDSYDNFTSPDGSVYCVLSDGMGHGKSAALDSKICTGLFRKLVCAGVGCETAIKLINTSMLMKSCEESFASLDVIKITPETGDMVLYKSGASATLIYSNDRVICIKAASFPIGIVSNAEPFKKEMKLKSGDTAVMLSDGIDEAYYPMIRNMMTEGDDSMAFKICEAVSINDKFRRRDDITAAFISIGERQ